MQGIKMNSKETARGFTLVELLMALLILGELATFTTPKILTAQQSQRYNSQAKEAMGIIASAYQLYYSQGTLSASTTTGNILSYLNYVKTDSSTTIDQSYSYGTTTCSTGANLCYVMHNGGILRGYSTTTFGGTNTTNNIWFLYDPDATTDGTTNGPGKSLLIYLYYNGRVSTYSGVNNTTSDPPWFSL